MRLEKMGSGIVTTVLVMSVLSLGLTSCSDGTRRAEPVSPRVSVNATQGDTPSNAGSVNAENDGSDWPKEAAQESSSLHAWNKEMSQWYEKVARCLNEKGWMQTHVIGPEGRRNGIAPNIPEGQSASWRADEKECSDALGGLPFYSLNSRERYAELFDERVETAACLRSKGYEISEPPTLDVFVRQQEGDGSDVWDPRAEVLQAIRDLTERSFLEEHCLYGYPENE